MRPWSMSQRRALDRILALSIVLVLAASCAVLPPYRDYAGPERPDDQIAILKWAVGIVLASPSVYVSNIDGQQMLRSTGLFDSPVPSNKARLLPGKHIIVYGVGLCKLGCKDATPTATIDMKAGHVYLVKGDRWDLSMLIFDNYYRANVWIEDEATGEVLHGSKTPY